MEKRYKLIVEKTITIDTFLIRRKYPNFNLNYESIEDFVRSCINDSEEDYLSEYGYKIENNNISIQILDKYKYCNNCGSEFKPNKKLKSYCSVECQKEMRRYQKKMIARKSREKEKHLTNIRRKAVTKLAENSGKPYTKKELKKILARNIKRKWKYSSTDLALELGRSIHSIQLVRRRHEKAKK